MPTSLPDKPTVSLLTSSSSEPLRNLRREFRGEVRTVEIYALREADVHDLGIVADRERNMVDILAGARASDITRWAGTIKEQLGIKDNEIEPGALHPVGVATFLPQLASPCRQPDALKALKNVLILCAELDVRCAEVVCGKVSERCPQTVRRPDGGQERCSAIFYESRTQGKHPRILEGLKQLLDFVRNDLRKPVAVALEVEPGPLYCVKNLDNAADILRATSAAPWILEDGDKPFHFVGLNLDIGHMLICHEHPTTAWQRIPPDRVYNFHISDNAEIHFGDLVPGMIHSIDPDEHSAGPATSGTFADWLRCFLCLCKEGNRVIFRKNISVELEACSSPQWAHRAIRNTTYLLDRLQARGDDRPDACRACPLYS